MLRSHSTTQASSATLLGPQVIGNHVILDRTFAFLSSQDILSVSRTCRMANANAKSYFRRARDINRRLKCFFPDLTTFRALQARTGAVIPSSMSLDDRYRGDKIEIHVLRPQLLELGKFLLANGYEFRPSAPYQGSDFEDTCSRLTRSIALWQGGSMNYAIHHRIPRFFFVRRSVDDGNDVAVEIAAVRSSKVGNMVSLNHIP